MPEEPEVKPGEEGKTFDWAGKKLTSDELYAEAQKIVADNSRLTNDKKSLEQAAAILNDPEKLAEWYSEKYGTNEPDEGDLTAQEKQAMEFLLPLLEKHGVMFNDPDYLKEAGVLTREDAAFLRKEVRIDRMFDVLEETIDGTDGRPAFTRQEFARHLRENNVTWSGELDTKTITKIYEEMHQDKLATWRADRKKDIDEPNLPGTHRGGGGGRKPEGGKPQKITFSGGDDSLTPAQAVAQMEADGVFKNAL